MPGARSCPKNTAPGPRPARSRPIARRRTVFRAATSSARSRRKAFSSGATSRPGRPERGGATALALLAAALVLVRRTLRGGEGRRSRSGLGLLLLRFLGFAIAALLTFGHHHLPGGENSG